MVLGVQKPAKMAEKWGGMHFVLAYVKKKLYLRTSAFLFSPLSPSLNKNSPVATFASCGAYANERFFASRVVPPLRIIDSLRPRRIGIYPSRRRVLTKGYVKTRRAGGELLRKGISRYPHGPTAL